MCQRIAASAGVAAGSGHSAAVVAGGVAITRSNLSDANDIRVTADIGGA
jgi:hypothetical protein